MKKKSMIIGFAFLIVVTLCGCQKKISLEKIHSDVLEKTYYPDEKDYVEKGILAAQNIAAQEGSADWKLEKIQEETPIEIIEYAMEEDGHGIMLFKASQPLDNYEINNAVVITTKDNGKTWKANKKQLLYDYEICDRMIMKENVVMFPTQTEKKQMLYISQDYGKSFEEHMISFPETMEIDLNNFNRVYINLKDVNFETNSIYLSWSVSPWWVSENIELGEGWCDYEGTVSVSKENSSVIEVLEFATGEKDYLVSDSDSHFLDSEEVSNYSILGILDNCKHSMVYQTAINLAINEIYAKMGYDFKGTRFEEYFINTSWYNQIPKKSISESDMNQYQKANIDLLVAMRDSFE